MPLWHVLMYIQQQCCHYEGLGNRLAAFVGSAHLATAGTRRGKIPRIILDVLHTLSETVMTDDRPSSFGVKEIWPIIPVWSGRIVVTWLQELPEVHC